VERVEARGEAALEQLPGFVPPGQVMSLDAAPSHSVQFHGLRRLREGKMVPGPGTLFYQTSGEARLVSL